MEISNADISGRKRHCDLKLVASVEKLAAEYKLKSKNLPSCALEESGGIEVGVLEIRIQGRFRILIMSITSFDLKSTFVFN